MWWLVIGGIVAIIVSTVALWAWLPEPIAVQWGWGGQVTNTMPKVGYMLVWSGAWALVSSSLVLLRAPLDWRRWLFIATGGVLVAAHVTILESNFGADTWAAAKSLDIPAATALALIGTGGVWLAQRRLER